MKVDIEANDTFIHVVDTAPYGYIIVILEKGVMSDKPPAIVVLDKDGKVESVG